ncbi:UNVERIFIED_CONTAM: hypothetical protein Sradi_4887400 [Sesamum radiatum]|uniref:Uncharacterized protein n=1 Tax=Sesamum radiatum TaxID=300843 RepID=A0AAW2MF04_SESRA
MTVEEGEHKQQWWNLFVDGSSTLQGSGVGVILETPQVQNRKITLLTQEYAVIEDPANEVLVSTSKPCWKDTIEANLTTGSLPTDRKDARTIRTRATRFTMIGGELYKRGFSQPYLKCLDPERAEYVLREVHEGSCGNHSGGRSLAGTPQSNGQIEVTKRTILQHLKTRLDEAKGNRVDELPWVLWAYKTTPRRSTGESAFNLVYRMEAIISAEIGEETF